MRRILTDIIYRARQEFCREFREYPETISMDYEMYKRLEIESTELIVLGSLGYYNRKKAPQIFGMDIEIIPFGMFPYELRFTSAEKSDFYGDWSRTRNRVCMKTINVKYDMEREFMREKNETNLKPISIEVVVPEPLTLEFDFGFGKSKKKEEKNSTMPDKYIINEGATVLFYGEEKTIVKRSKDDKHNKRLAFLTAYFQKNSGMSKSKANKYLDNLVDESEIKNEKVLPKKMGKQVKNTSGTPVKKTKKKMPQSWYDSRAKACEKARESRNKKAGLKSTDFNIEKAKIKDLKQAYIHASHVVYEEFNDYVKFYKNGSFPHYKSGYKVIGTCKYPTHKVFGSKIDNLVLIQEAKSKQVFLFEANDIEIYNNIRTKRDLYVK